MLSAVGAAVPIPAAGMCTGGATARGIRGHKPLHDFGDEREIARVRVEAKLCAEQCECAQPLPPPRQGPAALDELVPP
ncbi:hypothetical protein EMIHUDRAFT_364618 [Emiliania huxleyi CCMP1516]|uniref:Uncharacterized protein n=2 Tax=Emiliania huxleyi TaxID=2903 RepID=A0A0D3K9I8_EMIH1|nr:hypothetical protein EMIHUDRAFT_364618 [Emiliania huxleyi CCMP1516]EOD32423.1 hypothetical protein EMIHUDRAFT_364618 [Emiliania huxleyi CCMP1516]|eukprot:XP_005784852.1 hypothetical protein EMIHUDRAFT_364618 [Emiliania huxleyi CCMP1516]